MTVAQGKGKKERPRDARVRTPVVLQMEATECGAASLSIVMAHFGSVVPLEELRVACDVGRNGTNASNILKAARTYGMEAAGYRKIPETLRKMEMPVIIHWNFQHFLVLEGFKGDQFYLSDPAQGRYSVSADEFDESFTGVTLVLKPGPEFRKGRRKPTLLGMLAERLRESRRELSFVILAALALVLPGLAVPAFTTIFVDEFLIRRRDHVVLPLLACMAAVMLLNAGLSWLQQHCLLRLGTRLSLKTASAFLWHVLQLPMEFFTQRSAGEVGTRVAINDRVASLLSGTLGATFLDVLTAFFYLGLMLFYDGVLATVALAVAAVNVVGLRLVSRRRVDASRRLLLDEGNLAGMTMGGLRGMDMLKATGTESDFYSQWTGQLVKKINSQQALGVPTGLLLAVPPLLQATGIAAVLSVGAVRVMDRDLTLGMLIAFQFLAMSFMAPINRLVNLGSLLQQTEGDMDRLEDVLRYKPAPDVDLVDAPVDTAAADKLSGALELRGVAFGYARFDPPLIRDFHLKLRPGERLALVGGTGSGKSTVGRLVCGLYQPWEGDILFDGLRRPNITRASMSRSISLVDQDISAFHGTIRDNLTLWDPSIPQDRVEAAARDACVHDIVVERGGYDSEIREGGTNFSGGQLQRIAIARALATDPVLLVLDEATSALDPTTEKQVMDNITARGCTCLIVAHRLTTVRDCEEILVLDHGKVIERGTHSQLLALGGHYAALIAAA